MRLYFYDIHTREELCVPGTNYKGADHAGSSEAGIANGKRYMDTVFSVEIIVGRNKTRTLTAEDFPGRIVAVKEWMMPAADRYNPEPKPMIEWRVLIHRKQGFVGNESPICNTAPRVKLGQAARDLVPVDAIPDPEPPKNLKATLKAEKKQMEKAVSQEPELTEDDIQAVLGALVHENPTYKVAPAGRDRKALKALTERGHVEEGGEVTEAGKAAYVAAGGELPTFQKRWWLPTIPYSVIDAINRTCAAQGSVRRAMGAANADYNGHFVTVSFNDFRQYWITQYTWSGRNVLARGTLEQALRAGLRAYERGALGTQIMAYVKTAEDAALAESLGYKPYSKAAQRAHDATWHTDLHDKVGEAYEYEKHGTAPLLGVLANAQSIEDYEAKKEAMLAERRARRA